MGANEAHARVAGKISLKIFAFIFATLSDNPSFSSDLEEQLTTSRREIEEVHRREIDLENRHEILQWEALGAVAAVNARGVSLEDCLQDILVGASEVATDGARYGASATLVAAQPRLGYELRHLEPSFSDTDWLEDQEDLIEDFTDAAEAITMITHAKDVVNNIFLGR
jgi:hypothetical protein